MVDVKLYDSWGRANPASKPAGAVEAEQVNSAYLAQESRPVLPYGYGRSYGDSCLIKDGILIVNQSNLHLLDFDPAQGILRCEAGCRLDDLLSFLIPRGYFLPVVPGTKFISIGGAVANDVHGKNHHVAGTFGCHVRRLELVRSDGVFECSKDKNADLFRATIGGLGLTGQISWVEFALKKIESGSIDEETLRFNDLEEFEKIEAQSKNSPYTVAWLDCANLESGAYRGIYIRGDHAKAGGKSDHGKVPSPMASAFFEGPDLLINPLTMRWFNQAYFMKSSEKARRVSFNPFFFPLDVVSDWNRIYGKRGFRQYQSVVPDIGTIDKMLRRMEEVKLPSSLAVLKRFGDVPSPGLLSFPKPGLTLAMDFRNTGENLDALLHEFDEIVAAAGGRVYPAKDGRISKQAFQNMYPQWTALEKARDPHFMSDFWRRVSL